MVAVGHQVHPELAARRLDAGIDLARRHLHALGHHLEMVDQVGEFHSSMMCSRKAVSLPMPSGPTDSRDCQPTFGSSIITGPGVSPSRFSSACSTIFQRLTHLVDPHPVARVRVALGAGQVLFGQAALLRRASSPDRLPRGDGSIAGEAEHAADDGRRPLTALEDLFERLLLSGSAAFRARAWRS